MKHPPTLLARTALATFVMVCGVLAVVFVVLLVQTRNRVRTAETEKLQVSEQMFTALDAVQDASLKRTINVEVQKLATMTAADAIAIVGTDGRVFASAG